MLVIWIRPEEPISLFTCNLPPNNTLPLATYNAYGLVIITFVPALGAFEIYTVAAFVNVTLLIEVAFKLANVGVPNDVTTVHELVTVEPAPVKLSENVEAIELYCIPFNPHGFAVIPPSILMFCRMYCW